MPCKNVYSPLAPSSKVTVFGNRFAILQEPNWVFAGFNTTWAIAIHPCECCLENPNVTESLGHVGRTRFMCCREHIWYAIPCNLWQTTPRFRAEGLQSSFSWHPVLSNETDHYYSASRVSRCSTLQTGTDAHEMHTVARDASRNRFMEVVFDLVCGNCLSRLGAQNVLESLLSRIWP